MTTFASRLASSAAALLLLMSASAARGESSSGIISMDGAEAILSTRDMTPGAEMWALVLSLAPGGKVVSPGTSKSKWIGLELVTDGTALWTYNYAKGVCSFVGRGGPQDLAGVEFPVSEGDASICTYSGEVPWQEENREDRHYTKVTLYVGGPSVGGDFHPGPEYEKSGTTTYWQGLESSEFEATDGAVREAGAMKLSIRRVAMSPGSRMVTPGRYPVFRFVRNGKLSWGSLPPSAPTTEEPKSLSYTLGYNWIDWIRADQTVLINKSDLTVEFIEFKVEPAPGQQP